MQSSQITTFTFFQFSSFKGKFWAFSQMGLAHSILKNIEGQTFYKLMGSGRGEGFSFMPDFSIYVLMQVWESILVAEDFLTNSSLIKNYNEHCENCHTVYSYNIASHGLWDGQSPFKKPETNSPSNGPIIVLTRATIKWSKMIRFWRYVPTSHNSLKQSKGLLYAKGVGEWPFRNMATISMWRDEEAMKNFAYSSKEHRKAIALTKELNWYKEELFARFEVFNATGDLQSLSR
ncbi:MAG: spheroidene monooxygenase [Fulvivirga sp.]|uniref:spheroidene monooxygenase n=1 Tax=Fulvivirga sp. TaxID=1931237 RepID=UPI0032EBE405